MNADSGMTYQSSSNRPAGGAQWRGCESGEPWKLVEILAMVLGFIVFLANRSCGSWLEVLAKEIRLSRRHRCVRPGKMECELGLWPVGFRGGFDRQSRLR